MNLVAGADPRLAAFAVSWSLRAGMSNRAHQHCAFTKRLQPRRASFEIAPTSGALHAFGVSARRHLRVLWTGTTPLRIAAAHSLTRKL